MIFLDNITKIYRTKNNPKIILQDYSCTFPSGKNLGILGLNGAGKSTLIRMLAGVEHPDSGRIYRNARISFPIGFSGTFATNLSGRENALFLARVYGINQRYVVKFTQDFAELGVYFDMPIKTYSSGMRARLAFGISMAINFDVYLVDEVIAVGDAQFQQRCKTTLEERFRHADVILVSHSTHTVQQYCDYAAILAGGKLTFYSDLETAFKVHQLPTPVN